MTERLIRVGEAGAFRYIGIQPPLPYEHANNLLNEIELPYGALSGSFARTVTPEDTKPFTEIGFEASRYLGSAGDTDVNDRIWKAAKQIGQLLSIDGDTVIYVDGTVQEGVSLF